MFSLVLGGLQAGGEELQRQAGVPISFVFIIQGLAIMFLVANWIRFNRKAPVETPKAVSGQAPQPAPNGGR